MEVTQSAVKLGQAIGKTGNINQGGLNIDVKILDAKSSYGTTRYLVTPVSGSDEVWVNADRVIIWAPEQASTDGQ